jgi:hypothetical protein
MTDRKPAPGVERQQRLSDKGLERLEKQLASGVNISAVVLEQWIKRYGDAASELIRKYRGDNS